MPISINNSLTGKKEPFDPLNPPRVNIYTCGVTVYDDSHIGHARSLYIFDVIRRYLKYRGFQVNFVRNITDIDDKIINKARQEKVPFSDITKKYIDGYYRDLQALAIEKADFEPRATENIEDMIKHIQGLIDKGYAYAVEGDVYFSVRKFKDYGKLSGQSIDQMQEAVRVEKEADKKDPLDFALWKKSAEDEPGWESPWGRGRPGWHIECSVMSQKFLKTETLDIHAGGRDLIFPHHENEIAQAEALTGKPFAKYWIHHGLLTINGQKMAKSAGNFVTIKDALEKYGSDELKLFFLSSHYASPIDFTEKKMDDARKMRERIEECLNRTFSITLNYPKTELKDKDFILRIKEEFDNSMDDDFNTPRALSCILDLIKETNKFIDEHAHDSDYIGVIKNAEFYIRRWLQNTVFGLSYIGNREMLGGEGGERIFVSKDSTDDFSDKELDLVNRREQARRNKNYAESDRLRIKLEKIGIIVKDTKEGPIYQRKS